MLYVTQEYVRETDALTIQCAIDYAEAHAIRSVVIPELNPRTNEPLWTIDRAILLPNDLTVFLEDAHLRMADDVRDNLFRNRNTFTPFGNTEEGEQHDIRLIGIGHAVIDGGEPNGLSEQLHRDRPDLYPSMFVNLAVYFHNVRGFEVRNIQFLNTRYWAVCFMYCRWGRISELDFRNYGTLENQDGIDLRIGCEYVTIENITGITGDDTIALTALPLEENELRDRIPGRSPDIHDVTIRNVISSTHGCALVRLLTENGAKEYDITIDTIKDTGKAIGGAAILLGTSDTMFVKDSPRVMGDLRNVLIRNVQTKTQRGINFSEPCQDVLIDGLQIGGKCEWGLSFAKNFDSDNVTVRNVTIDPDPDYHPDAAFAAKGTPEHAFRGLRVSDVTVRNVDHIFRNCEFPVDRFTYDPPRISYCDPEMTSLRSAYGRYFFSAYGKENKNRPADNRVDGVLKIEDEV